MMDLTPMRVSAKQSQSASGGRGRPSPGPEALTLSPVRGTSVRNKANFPLGRQDRHRDRSCETKPISTAGPGRWLRDRPLRAADSNSRPDVDQWWRLMTPSGMIVRGTGRMVVFRILAVSWAAEVVLWAMR